MKLPIVFAAAMAVAALPAAAQMPAGGSPVIVTPSTLAWKDAAGYPPGTKIAVLYGNPDASGAYALRLSVPDGTAIPPHIHDGAEYVTVLQGSLMVGLGSTVDTSKMQTLPTGSYVYIPAKLPHYARAKGDTVVQLDGMGPYTTTMVK
jgi:quercetin dioxygenase-like cupin family protein